MHVAPSAVRMTCVLCPYSACLPVLNALRTEGLDGLLNDLVIASSEDVSTSLSPSQSDVKTSVTEIAKELAGENKDNCEATNANTSKV